MGMEIRVRDAAAMEDLGKVAGEAAQPGQVFALCGPMGAGKTTWARGLVEGLGGPAGVASPTFTLVHEYPGGRLPVFHFDFHRATHAGEILALGWDDYLERGGVVVVEWADLFPDLFPPEARWLRLSHEGGQRLVAEA
jgi:tRNA threonylcarbamoyladenosine biosynthesis protein TsaE